MLFGHQMAVSVYAVINHVAFANYASTPSSLKATHSQFNIIQAADYSDFTYSHLHEKSAPTRCRYFGNQQFCKDNIVHFLARWKWSPAPTFAAFSSLNENNEPNRGGSHACTGDQLSSSSKDDAIYKNLEKEAAASSIYSGTDHSQYAQNPENEVILLDKLKAVQLHLLAMEQWNASRLELCHRCYQVSAANLIHYLALKSLDLDQLKEDLLCVGLLNLDSINHCVLASLVTGIQMLETLKSNSLDLAEKSVEGLFNDKKLDEKKFEQYTINSTRKKAFCNRELLLGPLHDEKSTHIMVTVGQEAAESETLLHDLLKKGTTIFRINCAHGNSSVWSEIVRRVKRSSQMLEKPCRILMDLAGPKLRTGKMKPGPTVVKISPKKDAFGNVILPAQVWLSPQGAGCPPAYVHPDAVLYVDGQEVLCKLEIGHVLTFSDTRGKQRTLKILKQFPVFGGVGFMAECAKTAYVHSGTKFCVKGSKRKSYVGVLVGVPPVEQFIRLRVGDLLTISRDSSNKQNEVSNSAIDSPRVTCPSGYLFDSVKPGETIAFDDGKIWGLIKGASISEIVVSITHAGPKGTNLGSDKSINIPESNIRFEGLTSKDLVDLDFVATHADMIGVSFIRDVRDVVLLRQELIKRKIQNVGIVLKIETKGGFEKLPLILLEAMKSPNPIGVMIARGDLAVECGWEKLATIQEEILSICSAAHVPVIWATQVLESLIKTGVPTRAEITDVASGKRASCIMLNKGKHVLDAVSTLDTILNNSCAELRSEFRPLVLSSHLF